MNYLLVRHMSPFQG